MTTNSFGPGQFGEQPPPAQPQPETPVKSSGSRKPLIAGLVAVGALAGVGVGAFFLLSSGDSEPTAVPRPSASAPAGEAAEEESATVAPVLTSFSARNPFTLAPGEDSTASTGSTGGSSSYSGTATTSGSTTTAPSSELAKAITGPAGPTGPAGSAGPAGADGAQGKTGDSIDAVELRVNGVTFNQDGTQVADFTVIDMDEGTRGALGIASGNKLGAENVESRITFVRAVDVNGNGIWDNDFGPSAQSQAQPDVMVVTLDGGGEITIPFGSTQYLFFSVPSN